MLHSHASTLRHGRNLIGCVLTALLGVYVAAGQAYGDGPQFESPPVHPIELSVDGTLLFAVHQADHRLIVFDLSSGVPIRSAEVFVGLEPVSVRARTATEVWVVNHLSDSISIVDLTRGATVATLQVGDEPTDVVFAGSPERAFVAVSQEDLIRVYDPARLEQRPVEIPLLQSDPTALAVSPDGQSIYVAGMDSGNQTTVVTRHDVEVGGGPPPPQPPMSPDLPPPPRTALIVGYDGSAWRDEIGRDWSDVVPYVLADQDVVEIDAATLTVTNGYVGVGTTLLGLAANPETGHLYVSNQEAGNRVRFEPNLNAQFLQNRITVIDPGTGQVSPSNLNPHIDYDNPFGTEQERAASLSIPTAMAVSSDGSEVYLAAFGSAQVGVLDPLGTVSRRLEVGDGPCGLALDEGRNKLYVLRRIPGQLTVVDLVDDSRTEVSLGYDPTPTAIHTGRQRFYDGRASSAHGDLSCASCHVYGSTDHTAWNLGDPGGAFIEGATGAHAGYHPMKGPLVTQALKGLTDTNPYHWRGDRPTLGDFNPAFVSLLGRTEPLSTGEFAELESFLLSLTYPPNPFRRFDGSLPNPSSGPNPIVGKDLFINGNLTDGSVNCIECHELPTGEKALVVPAVVLGEDVDQDLVIPHLRNLYEKTRFDRTAPVNVRGFGFTHDGSTDGLFTFFGQRDFTFESDEDKEHVVSYLMAFDIGTHRSVGAQWTMTRDNKQKGRPRVETWMNVAESGPLGLIAKGLDRSNEVRGWVYQAGAWTSDRSGEPPMAWEDLFALVEDGHELTVTGVYPGTEIRLGIDRDLDGFLDRDERDAGSDPGDPGSTPDPTHAPEILARTGVQLDPIWPNPSAVVARMAFRIPATSVASLEVFDVQGRRVRGLLDRSTVETGRHEAVWNLENDSGTRVSSGLYFAKLEVGDISRTQRIVVR